MNLLSGFLSNESAFGRLMTRVGIIIAVNILFALCTVPIITIGAGYAAMYYAFMRCLRGDGVINPFKEYIKGFKENFLQATIVWGMGLFLCVFLYLEYSWCSQFGGIFLYLRYGLLALGIVVIILTIYIFPVMAAFNGNLKKLFGNAIYFAFKKPLYLITILFFNIFPLVLTYSEPQNFPVYGFIWVTCGFGLVGMLTSYLLLQEFKTYLPMVDACGDIIENPEDEAYWQDGELSGITKSEKEILEEMKMLGM